jgi:5'-nucleotidase
MDGDRKSRTTIAVDLDEVTADTVSKRLLRYRADYGVELSREDIRGKQIRDAVPPERKKAVEVCLDEPGFSRDIPVMQDAQRVLKWLSARFDIFIATSAMDHPVSLYDRYLWLQEYLPFLTDRSYVFCGSKRILRADYLMPRAVESQKEILDPALRNAIFHSDYALWGGEIRHLVLSLAEKKAQKLPRSDNTKVQFHLHSSVIVTGAQMR